jgi:lycopene beta-cyclase
VQDIGARSVTLSDGRRLEGDIVVDARGPGHATLAKVAGYQKFVGLELMLGRDVVRSKPLLMDARVPQTDGFRFFYVLPLAARRVLVEDTYFSDSDVLATASLRDGILEYARLSGMEVRDVVRTETGVLPMPSRGQPEPKPELPLVAGYAGGWFHPATAYSFPVAVRLALHIATTTGSSLFGAEWAALVAEHRKQFRFGALLNRMLFGAFRPESRFAALERFYRLPDETIERFYALSTTRRDRLRIICGRPPRGMSLRFAA